MAKKHLGQNFLKSSKALGEIISSAEISEKDVVLEVGPGKGALTEKLLEKAGQVIAIEKDKELIPFLEEKFAEDIKNKKLILKEGDILTYDLSKIPNSYKVVANIPFYITGAIIEYFLESSNQPSKMALIIQKEVAERIVVRDGKESILSMSVKVFGQPKYISKIPARYFSPEPKVDSAILLIDKIQKPFGGKRSQKDKFFKVMKIGFSQKRKTLLKNLVNQGFDREKIENSLISMGHTKDIRAEKLSFEDWDKIIKVI